ncbi:MAG: hypothetical protein JXR65_12725 [Bacteroidales bacterium]|nr:hypothetical protein [Bacteroidales bacterium]
MKSGLQPIRFLSFFQLVFILLFIISCNDFNYDSSGNEPMSLSGKWSFQISPDKSYEDTSVLHGVSATQIPEGTSIYSEVYLYENKEHDIYGETWGYKIKGKHIGNNVELYLYEYPDGLYNSDVQIEEMNLFSHMQLIVNDYGILDGSGLYMQDENRPWTYVDTYLVEANKLNEISNAHLKTSLKEVLCDVASTFSSFAISYLTDGYFRPMSSCYGHKDGGGYYAFGHEGPGSILPVYTQTVYVAWEWSWCKVRKYDFQIKLEGEALGYEILKTTIKENEPNFRIIEKLGFDSFENFEVALNDFHEKFGDFAISMAYDTYTHNISLYVNHVSGSALESSAHSLVQTISDNLKPHSNGVNVYSGHTIEDSWHMKRSDFGVCNSKIIFVYLFGTNNVLYN